MFQTVAKTGNIGEKKTIDYLLTVLFLKSIFFLYPNNWFGLISVLWPFNTF